MVLESLWMTNWEIIKYGIIFVIFLNIILSIFTVFREKRDISATWAWLLVLILLPVVGLIIYSIIGRKLPQKRLSRLQVDEEKNIKAAIESQKKEIAANQKTSKRLEESEYRLVTFFQNTDDAFLSRENNVDVFTDGTKLFDKMIEDIQAATKHIHIEFYTFYNDLIGNAILRELEKKALEGVEVRVLYDSWGSMGTKRKFFDQLRANGGFAEQFLGVGSNLLNLRLNFRNHRKIVVIDGEIGYIGGFNIGDQYLSRDKKFGYWRDTHLRIEGKLLSLQSRFLRDWSATSNKIKITDYSKYIQIDRPNGNRQLQIVSSGPEHDLEKIKLGYLKLINMAQDKLWIQSPYLIPDDSVLDALKLSIKSGVDVRIMIPNMPDHPFVYRASQYYAHDLANSGAKIYFYENGFMHAKTMVVDGKVASVGSANMDFRSFKLNFEVNAFLYDKDTADDLEDAFLEDIRASKMMTPKDFEEQSLWLRIKQTLSRLLSPIL